MFLRRLFRQKCQETGRYNPFNTDIDFQFLPLRTKVEILYALCDFRLDADDVFELFKNLEPESLRVEPLGWDSNSSAYWYFYGTRLYREDYKVKPKGKKRKKEENKKSKNDVFEDDTERVWQVVCFTESDWINLTEKFKASNSKLEKDLFQSLSENFLPEIPRLFQEKERLQRKRLLEAAPRRTSSRVQIKQKQKEEEESKQVQDIREKKIKVEIQQHKKKTDNLERESRVRRREQLRTFSEQSLSEQSDSSNSGIEYKDMYPKRKKRKIKTRESSLAVSPSLTVPTKPTGRQTNNSLACATGQIVIPDIKEPVNPTRKKMKSSQIYELLDQDLVVDMYKVLEQLKSHDDAWPFMDPVEEDYAPNYYTVIRRPMDLKRMEDRLDQRYYTDFSMFKNDFKLIVNNCRLYNGQESEYTKMVNSLENAFNKLTQRYFEGESSSDDEIAIEYPILNLYQRKHSIEKRGYKNTLKNDYEEDPKEEEILFQRSEKRKSSENLNENDENCEDIKKTKKFKTSDDKSLNYSLEKKEKFMSKGNRLKKKKKLKRLQDARKNRKEKHKKTKGKRKHSKRNLVHNDGRKSHKTFEKQRSRSNSTTSLIEDELPVATKRHSSPEIDFYKDKFDKIKERRRGCVKKIYDSGFEKHKEKKSNITIPEKDKHLNLKETIEKLKAKSENVKPASIYSDHYEEVVVPAKKEKKKCVDFENAFSEIKKKTGDEYEFVDDDDNDADDHNDGDLSKENDIRQQVSIKNESAREALEQAMKDINKWLDDTPKLSEFGSNSNSPLQIPITEDYNISPIIKQDDETSNSQSEKDKSGAVKKECSRKRQTNKDSAKIITKKKEVQRTIDRLQPGKSKGNLITNIQTTAKQEEVMPIVKTKELKTSLTSKPEEGSPKLSLGTVLPTVGFGLGKQHNFTPEQNSTNTVKVEVVDMGTMTGENELPSSEANKPDVNIVVEPISEKSIEPPKVEESMKQCQEKATPNLSAWFKAFGAPKSSTPSTLQKKKADDYEQDDSKIGDDKNTSPLDNVKNEQNDDMLGADGSESPVGNLGSSVRARRTSTGSSISERSSFSQDLDSPRHQPSHTSPLLRSPASPRGEDLQKTYPLMNVTVRVGFYQDTTSVKSSPEKSCSPREAPQSPYTNYSQHVYASSSNGNNGNNPAVTYSAESSNKSPIPAYAQSPFYENVKANATKSSQDDFPVYTSDSVYQQPSSPFASAPFSPGKSPYSYHSQHSPYSLVQSPQTSSASTSTTSNVIQMAERRPIVDKLSAFPVKKRSYEASKDAAEDEPCLQIREVPMSLDNDNSTPPNVQLDEPSVTNAEVVNSPSVITSTLSKSFRPSSIGYCDPIIARDLSKQNKEDYHGKNIHPQYSEYVSDYSLKKPQVNDYSLAGLSKTNSDLNVPSVNAYQESQFNQSFNEMKHTPKSYSHDFSLKEKQVDMVNMGYSNKKLETAKGKETNVDMINMGYAQTEAHAHLSKLTPNHEDFRNITSYYNPPSLSFAGRVDQNKGSLTNNDFIESNKRFSYNEKNASVLQYMKTGEAENSQLSSPLSRTDINRQGILDNSDCYVKNTTNHMYKDWMKKNQDPHNYSLYKDNQPKTENRLSISQMATSSLASGSAGKNNDTPTYDTVKSSSDETPHKKQTELIVQPNSGVHYFRAVIEISSSIKPDSQPTSSEYNLRRNVNLTLPASSRSENTNYDRNTSITPSNSYKTSHSQTTHTTEQPLLNIPNLPQIMERYAKDERMLSPYPSTSVSSAYQDKNLSLMFPKTLNSMHSSMVSPQIYQSSASKSYGRTDNLYSQSSQPTSHNWSSEPISLESDKKVKTKKKRSTPVSSTATTSSPSYHNYTTPKSTLSSNDQVMSLKPPMLPGSAFNFGSSGSLASSLYGDSSYFLDPSANQYMAANYIAAHQRGTPEIDKGGKPAHSSTPFQFLSPQARASYPLVGMESPIYQHYIQRQQEEILRPLPPHIMGMFPPGYNPSLGGRQPFDSIPRPWL